MDEPSEFSWKADRKRSVKVYRSWADQAWFAEYSLDPGQRVSNAYVAGFKDGFVDFVFGGGSGEPPPVPPRQYWNVGERNPCGQSKATEWFAGYRHGAQVAHNEGYREQAIVPASVFMVGPQDDCHVDKPCLVEPLLVPWTEGLIPELVPPGNLEAAANADASEPEMSLIEPPAIAPPSVEAPSTKEEFPAPLNVPDKQDSTLQQVPIERTPKSPPAQKSLPPSTDVDDLFGLSAPKFTNNDSPAIRQSNFESPAQEATWRQQARKAFSQAVPSCQTSKQRRQRSKQQHVEKKVVDLQTSRISVPRSAVITRSDDKAEAMYRRLSR